jgi:hypothetical protein
MPDVAHGFQLHPARESASSVTALLVDLASRQPEWRIGATIHLPRQKLADPESPRLDRAFDNRGRGRKDFDYLAESEPAANHERFVADVLEAQRQAGATALISPWMVHGLSQTEHELSTTIRFAEDAQTVAAGEHLLMGLEATEGVFANTQARNAMINELVEGPELPVYLRMRVNPPAGYKPFQELDSLSGLRDVVLALEDNDRPVALPQSGLPGWLMAAFGARSFGAGMAGSMQRSSAPTSGGGGQPPLHWYFVPQLLGFVLAEEMNDVAGVEGFEVCDCPYCDEELPGEGAAFDASDAGRHFVWWCAKLAAELDTGDPATLVSSRVEAASEFASAVHETGVSLDERSQPTHLPVWQAVLAS